MGGAAQQPGERLLLGQQRHAIGQAVLEGALVAPELEREHGQCPSHGIQVGTRRGALALGRDLGGLVADGPVDRLIAVDAAHAVQVDELGQLFGLDDWTKL